MCQRATAVLVRSAQNAGQARLFSAKSSRYWTALLCPILPETDQPSLILI